MNINKYTGHHTPAQPRMPVTNMFEQKTNRISTCFGEGRSMRVLKTMMTSC